MIIMSSKGARQSYIRMLGPLLHLTSHSLGGIVQAGPLVAASAECRMCGAGFGSGMRRRRPGRKRQSGIQSGHCWETARSQLGGDEAEQSSLSSMSLAQSGREGPGNGLHRIAAAQSSALSCWAQPGYSTVAREQSRRSAAACSLLMLWPRALEARDCGRQRSRMARKKVLRIAVLPKEPCCSLQIVPAAFHT